MGWGIFRMVSANEKFAADLKDSGVELSEKDLAYLGAQFSKENVSEDKPRTGNIKTFNFGYGGGGVYSNTGYVPITFGIFNGQKTAGSMGLPMDLRVDPRALRFRAYEANLTNDIITIITGKFFKWVVGAGLKMQSEPSEKILSLEKVDENLIDFRANVEEYFKLYGDSPRSDYAGMDNLHINAAKAFETAFLGGDAVIILRVDDNNNINVQVIDGQHVDNPILGTDQQKALKDSGNVLISGIEMDKRGKHIAYWVRKQQIDTSIVPVNADYERIEAYGAQSGCLMAWMVYGKKARIDHHRGISVLSPILEKVTKIDRYTEATVAGAEERAKLVWTVNHGKTSDGSNPFIDGPRARNGLAIGADAFAQGQLAANQIALTEDRKVYNLPVDSELKSVSSQQEINYEPFFKAVFVQLCAAVDIPPEVALQQYSSNYSASRAAINGWGYIVDIYRKRLADKFYQPFYDLWLYIHILKGKVSAKGYIKALNSGNTDVVEAYSVAKFTGVNMPHIDPLKEINAIRAALGPGYANVPLISFEQAAALNNNGDWESNIKKLAEENKLAAELDVVPAIVAPGSSAPAENEDDEEDNQDDEKDDNEDGTNSKPKKQGN